MTQIPVFILISFSLIRNNAVGISNHSVEQWMVTIVAQNDQNPYYITEVYVDVLVMGRGLTAGL